MRFTPIKPKLPEKQGLIFPHQPWEKWFTVVDHWSKGWYDDEKNHPERSIAIGIVEN